MNLVTAVRAHAEKHYLEDGWDFLVECWEDDYILQMIDGTDTPSEAIERCAAVLTVLAEQRAAVRAEIF
jgi:hypothetical protein